MSRPTSGVDPSLSIPVFAQLKALLLEAILDGTFAADEKLPTEFEICERYGISRTPAHRALAELAEEGVVIRRRRAGTIVNAEWLAVNKARRRVRVVVPEGSWAAFFSQFAPGDIELDVTQVSLTQLHDHLVRAVASGTAPDLALLDSVWVTEFARNGFIRPLDALDRQWVSDELESAFASTFVNAHRIGDQTLAVQFEADVAGLWFDRELLSRLQVPLPSTWGELRTAARKCRVITGSEVIALPAGPAAGEASSYVLISVLASNGAAVLGADTVTLHSDRAVESLEFLRALRSDGLIDPQCVMNGRERPISALAERQVAFAFGGSYELPALAHALGVDQDEAWERFGFIPFPAGPSGHHSSLAGGMALCVFRQSGRPELAMRALRALVGDDAQRSLAESTGQIPSRFSVAGEIAEPGSLLAVSGEQLNGAVMRPLVDSYERVSQQLQSMMAEVIAGDVVPRSAAVQTARMVSAITGLPLAQL
ncbi:MAG: extracellular solute-binding protein [Mycetocola sp.]